jgi:TfoX/Sxy family transcriptional regulator of competence genes
MASRSKAKSAAADPEEDERYADVVTRMKGLPDVDEGRMFGSVGLRVNGKVFAMLVKGALVIKLPAERCNEIVKSRQGQLFDPGHGRVMKEWVQTTKGAASEWRKLAEEALVFVKQGAEKKQR